MATVTIGTIGNAAVTIDTIVNAAVTVGTIVNAAVTIDTCQYMHRDYCQSDCLIFLGAKFKKYLGHSAHVTNVRFTYNQSHVISVGGADNAIFQWKFIPPGGGVADSEDESVISQLRAGSETEGSDSELSDVGSLDSDLQREEEMTYDRCVLGGVVRASIRRVVKVVCMGRVCAGE